MLEPVLTLDADLTVAQASAILGALAQGRASAPSERMIVVRRRDPRDPSRWLWYAVPLAVLGQVVAVSDPALPLGVALDLHEHQAGPAADLDDPGVRDGSFAGVVTRAGSAVGYATGGATLPRKPTRGIEFPPAPAPAPPPPPDAAPVDGGGPVAPQPPSPTPAKPPTTATVHPRVIVPAEVAPSQRFDVEIGLGDAPQLGVTDAPMTLLLPPRRKVIELTVTVVADGFAAPAGVSRTLLLPRDDLVSSSVRIPLIAPTLSGDNWSTRIQVEYAVAGTLLGRAWRDLVVRASRTPTDPPAPPSSRGADLPLTDAGIDSAAVQAVDLTVAINPGATAGTLVWTFTSPHQLGLADEQITSQLRIPHPQVFAEVGAKLVEQADRSISAEDRIQGISRMVSEATPVALWTALTTVWGIAKGEGRVPRVLLVAAEPHLPWELASTEKRWVVDRTLVDEYAPQVLGAQCQVGRWAPAGPEDPDKLRRPPVAPEHGIQVRRLAVVIGDYHSQTGVRPLPMAEEEGATIAETYPSLRLTATLTDMTALLNGRLAVDGQPAAPEVVHVACHGHVDDKPESNGIVLSDTALRIDESTVRGGELADAGAPLVFLNACQLAQASDDLLADQGGLAAAFLNVGARAFVAPLWSVDDLLARDMGIDFYRYTLGDGLSAGEALRRLRTRFSQIPGHAQTTPLAYVYYGHPDLRLTLAG